MKRQSDSPPESKVLLKIKRQFTRFRSIGGGRYPRRLKAMAVSAVSGGLGKRSVARAAGVSTSMIYYWMAGAPKVKRLKLIEASADCSVYREVVPNEALVCIRLASGVTIDFPRSELTGELLATLNSIGGQR